MKVRFLDPSEVERFRQGINNDPEFRIAAKYMTKDVLLEVGDSQCIVRVSDGLIAEMNLAPTFMDPWDFAIRSQVESWEKFLRPVPPPFYTGLYGAMIRGIIQVVGDLEAAFSYFWAVNRMLDVMRDLQNSRF